MWFNNIFVYRLATDWAMSATTLEEKLSLTRFRHALVWTSKVGDGFPVMGMIAWSTHQIGRC